MPGGGGLWRGTRARVDGAGGERKRYDSSQTRPTNAARMEPYVLRARRWRRVVDEERGELYAAVEVDDFRGYGN